MRLRKWREKHRHKRPKCAGGEGTRPSHKKRHSHLDSIKIFLGAPQGMNGRPYQPRVWNLAEDGGFASPSWFQRESRGMHEPPRIEEGSLSFLARAFACIGLERRPLTFVFPGHIRHKTTKKKQQWKKVKPIQKHIRQNQQTKSSNRKQNLYKKTQKTQNKQENSNRKKLYKKTHKTHKINTQE